MKNKGVENKWCCSGLAKAFSVRNESTIFIFSDNPDGVVNFGPTFWVAMRSIHKNDYGKIENIPINTFIVATRKRIHFCPWCGINLASMYPTYPNLLTDQEIEKEFSH